MIILRSIQSSTNRHKSDPEIVQLLCGQCIGDCYKQQTDVTAVAIFLRLP